MNPNYILAVLSILILLGLLSSLIAGDVFLSKIAFSTSALNCDSFSNLDPSAKESAPTNNACINLTTTEIGFAKFRIVMFWIMFAVLTVLLGMAIVLIASANIIATIFVGVLGISLWVLMLLGGIYLTQFAFFATPKNCNNPGNISNYCYDLSTTQLGFAKLTAVLCFPMTIALTLSMAYVIIKSI